LDAVEVLYAPDSCSPEVDGETLLDRSVGHHERVAITAAPADRPTEIRLFDPFRGSRAAR
jgi:hypothetical protein